MNNLIKNDEANKLISSKIENNIPINVGRVGRNELQVCIGYNTNTSIESFWLTNLQNNAGVYGSEKDILEFCEAYIGSISKADLHVYWDMGEEFKQLQTHFFRSYAKDTPLLENRSVEPFHFQDPWSKQLKDKNVLVVNPLGESIYNQYRNRDLLWDNKDILPEFNLTVYQNVQSIGNNGPHSGWSESFNIMKKEISELEFDIALLGCGAYGMPLCTFIKEQMNKTAIYVGGGLQILFGIKGKRWDTHDEISVMYNENWVRPLPHEIPTKKDLVENGCYW